MILWWLANRQRKSGGTRKEVVTAETVEKSVVVFGAKNVIGARGFGNNLAKPKKGGEVTEKRQKKRTW